MNAIRLKARIHQVDIRIRMPYPPGLPTGSTPVENVSLYALVTFTGFGLGRFTGIFRASGGKTRHRLGISS